MAIIILSVAIACVIVWALLRSRPYSNLPLRKLKSKDSRKQDSARQELAKRQDRSFLPALVALLCDDAASDLLRYQASLALGEIRDPTTVESLLKILEGQDRIGRRCAANALGGFSEPVVVNALLRSIRDDYEHTRKNSAGSLGKILGSCTKGEINVMKPAVIHALILGLSDNFASVRAYSAEALGQIGGKSAASQLASVLTDDSDRWVRSVARTSLEHINPKHVALHKSSKIKQRSRKSSKRKQPSDGQTIILLERLCRAYATNDRDIINELEPAATWIGKQLDEAGGIAEMRRIFQMIPPQQGRRTLEMHWGGIGDWRG